MTPNELIEYLGGWRDKDKPVVYTVYSVADLDNGGNENPFSDENYKRWEDNIGLVDKAMRYAEQDMNEALTEIFGDEND
jgi:hypothetical protein